MSRPIKHTIGIRRYPEPLVTLTIEATAEPHSVIIRETLTAQEATDMASLLMEKVAEIRAMIGTGQ